MEKCAEDKSFRVRKRSRTETGDGVREKLVSATEVRDEHGLRREAATSEDLEVYHEVYQRLHEGI